MRDPVLLISPYWREPKRWMISTLQLAQMWKSAGYEVHVLCIGRKEEFFEEDASKAASVTALPGFVIGEPFRYAVSFRFFRELFSLVRVLKPRHIVVNKVLFWTSIAAIPLRLAGYKVIVATDALIGITWKGRTRRYRVCSALYAWTLGWLILKCAARVVFFHPQPDRVLRKLGISKKSLVIPSTIDDRKLAGFRRVETDVFTVLYAGRLAPVKGIDDLLAAAKRLQEKGEKIRFRIAGEYSHAPDLPAQYPYVEFLGLNLDTPPLFAAADVFVLPSHAEGLSNALLEAMATGTPCIGTEVGGTAHLLADGCGLLFKPGDVHALESHILRLANDPALCAELGAKAAAKFKAGFTREIVSMKWREFFAQEEVSNIHR